MRIPYAAALLFLINIVRCVSATQPLEIVRPILDQTVDLGTNVTFEIRYRSDAPVAIQWSHDTNILTGATNSTLVVTNVGPQDIGCYTVILSSDSARLTNSAILDIDVPYFSPRFSAADPIMIADQDNSGFPNLAVESFRNGMIAAPTGLDFVIWRTPGWWNIRLNSLTVAGQKAWTSGIYIASGVPLFNVRFRTYENNFIFGYTDDLDSTRTSWYTSCTSFGQTNWARSYRFHVNDSVSDEVGNCHFYTQSVSNVIQVPSSMGPPLIFKVIASGCATIVGPGGENVFSNAVPYGFKTGGRFFAGSGNVGYLSELNYAPRSASATVCGAFSLAGGIEWITEVDQIGSIEPLALGSGDGFFLARGDRGLMKILKSGDVAWSIPITDSPLLKPFTFRQNQITIFAQLTNALSVGGINLPASQDDPFVFLQIDQGGVVRTATRLRCAGLDFAGEMTEITRLTGYRQGFTFKSPGHYETTVRLKPGAQLGDMVVTSPSNQWYSVSLEAPDPDPTTPAKSAFTQTVAQGESITLKASPDLPGFVLYQWLRDGRRILNATNHDLTISGFSFGDDGVYSVAIRNAYGSATNSIATLNYSGPAVLAADAQTANGVVLRWPSTVSNYRLEETADLGEPFVPAAGTVTTNAVAGRIEFSAPAVKGKMFYRLRFGP